MYYIQTRVLGHSRKSKVVSLHHLTITIRRRLSKYSAIFTEPEVNNNYCFSIIFKGECEKLE